MVSFEQLSKAVSKHQVPQTQDDLRKEVERLRFEVQLAAQGVVIEDVEGDVDIQMSPESVLRGFSTPEDFVIKEGSLNYEDGSSYKGELLGTLRHGTGTYIQADGTKYSGQWRYNFLEGKGTAVTRSGQRYEGEFKQGRAHGQGIALYENGSRYEGDWEADVRHGWGAQSFPTGDHYEGEWVADKIHGQARWTFADGSFYEGHWVDGLKTKGRLVSPDGSEEYSGEWKDELRNGTGVQYIAKLYKYEGQWKDDLKHGQGRCEWIDGSVYEGSWKEGKRCGQGKYAMGDMRYDGEWMEDKLYGQGICLEDDGDRYMGGFENGQRSGFGRCLYADGTKYEGSWKEGKRHGQGTCVYAEGDVYKGSWEKDQRHGLGVCQFADGTKFKGRWEEDGWVQSGADPAQCHVAGGGVTRGVAGKKARFKILARDEDGNVRLSGGDEFQVLLVLVPEEGEIMAKSGAENGNGELIVADKNAVPAMPAAVTVTGEVQDCDDGTYEVSYIATVAGIYELNITIGATEHVADSPYPVRILPATPYHKATKIVGLGRSQAVVGSQAAFEILLHDEYGNRCADPPQVPLEVYLQGSGGLEIPVDMYYSSLDGRILCSYQAPSICGFYRLHIQWAGAALPGTPYSVTVAATEDELLKNVEKEANDATVEVNGEENADKEGANTSNTAWGSSHKKPTTKTGAGITDQMALWEKIAAAAYAADGVTDGWDSDEEERKKKETSEDSYMKSHPNVPVVENLEDLWLVSKLQRERKLKEEEEKRKKLEAMRERFEGEFGPGQVPSVEEAEAALKEILKDEAEKKSVEDAESAGGDVGECGATDQHHRVAAPRNGSRHRSKAELMAAAAALDDLIL